MAKRTSTNKFANTYDSGSYRGYPSRTAYDLENSYSLQKKREPSLTKGEFMQRLFPDRNFANEASARRTYNKIVSGEVKNPTSYRQELTEYVGPSSLRGNQRPKRYFVNRGGKEVRLGGTEQRAWKINVYFFYLNEQGEEVLDERMTRSIAATSYKYDSMAYAPYIADLMGEAVSERISWWAQYDSSQWDPNYSNYSVEAFLVRAHTTADVVYLEDYEL